MTRRKKRAPGKARARRGSGQPPARGGRQMEIALHDEELIVDNFAGGGGASLGIEWALGRSPDIAVNHDPEAVAMHAENHPATRHYCESVWKVNPVEVCGGRKVGLAWFSPDCKHHSKAKGGKPRDKKIRGLAWVVRRWAAAVRPRVIILENVEEFQDWGPLLEDGTPCPLRKGFTFRRWWNEITKLGYKGELRELRASDFGLAGEVHAAPTIRKRLFVIFRCDGEPIVWPEPTHGDGPGLERHRTAADCIDWTLPCPSVFLTRAQARKLKAETGIRCKRPLAGPTMRRIARGIWRYVIQNPRPFIVPQGDGLTAPTMIQTGYGERPGQRPRYLDLHAPVGTVMATGQKHALVTAFLAKHYGGHENDGAPMPAPFATVTCRDHHAVVANHLVKLRGSCADGQVVDEPAPTITAGGMHLAEVRALLIKYYGAEQGQDQELGEPLHTVTTLPRFALVTVAGVAYAIADIGMRMLVARELFRAQGFPDTYRIDIDYQGKPLTGEAQVKMCGNSVCPPLAAAIVRANFPKAARRRVAAVA